jgi:hypothetical protein
MAADIKRRLVYFRSDKAPELHGQFDVFWSDYSDGLSKLSSFLGHSDLHDYEQVLFMDGDLTVVRRDLDGLFDIADRNGYALCQPAVVGSVNHEVTWHRGIGGARCSGFVEIMCPLFSRAALKTCLHTFGASISGWGLDYVWSKLLGAANLFVVDDVVVRHNTPCDWRSGPFYAYLRQLGIDPWHELNAVRAAYDA